MRYLLLLLLVGCAGQKEITRASNEDLCYKWFFNEGLTDEGYRLKALELERRNIICGERTYSGYTNPPQTVIIVPGY